jgi:hypothetical protein
VSLEEFFVDRHVLDGDDAAPGLVFGNHVHERRWIPVAEALECLRDVDGHEGRVYQGWRRFVGFGVLRSQRSRFQGCWFGQPGTLKRGTLKP